MYDKANEMHLCSIYSLILLIHVSNYLLLFSLKEISKFSFLYIYTEHTQQMAKTIASVCSEQEILACSELKDPRYGTCVLDVYNIENLI